jgi:hypothetical protein
MLAVVSSLYGRNGKSAGDINGDGRSELLLADPEFGPVVRRQ